MGNSPAPLQAMSCAVVAGFQQLLEMGVSMKKAYAGTSGWAYATWKPDFYPATLHSTKFLNYYASRLNSVGSQLHVSEPANKKVVHGLDGGNTSGLQVCR